MILNYKIFLVTNVLILILVAGLISMWNQIGFINIYYIFPIWAALVICAMTSYEIRYASLLFELDTLKSKGEFEKANVKVDEILKSHFKREVSIYGKSVILQLLGKTTEALELLNEILEEDLNSKFKVNILHEKFIILLNYRSYGEADDFLDIALEEYPKNHLICLDDAELEYQFGSKEDAEVSYKKLLKLVDEKLLKFRKSFITRNRLPEKIWSAELNSILFEKAHILIRLFEYEKALECVNEIIEINPQQILVWNLKACLLGQLGYYEKALKCVDKSLDFNSKFYQALDTKGYILLKSGKPKDALKFYQQAVQINPEFIYAYYYKGQVHECLEQYSEALKCYDKVLELNIDCELAENAKTRITQNIT
jgi:tetratricopeptide (TPR) repeat protein